MFFLIKLDKMSKNHAYRPDSQIKTNTKSWSGVISLRILNYGISKRIHANRLNCSQVNYGRQTNNRLI